MIKIIASLCAEKRLNLLTRMLKSVDSGVLVVPEQFLFEAERSMYTMLGARRIADTVITGLSKLAADVIKTHGAPRPYADDIVKSVTMHKTLGRLKSSFTYYRGEKLSFSFTQQMLELTSDLKAAAITPALLRKGEAEGISHSARLCDISAKLCDITEIYSAYCETLAVYYEDGVSLFGEIDRCFKESNLELFVTYVHAIKSASANIGADALSSMAKELEIAGNNDDLGFIKAHLEMFLSGLDALLNNIHELLGSRGVTVSVNGAQINGVGHIFDPESFDAELKLLCNALAVLDIDAVDKSLGALKEFAKGSDLEAFVREISKHVLMAEFDEAEALIGTRNTDNS